MHICTCIDVIIKAIGNRFLVIIYFPRKIEKYSDTLFFLQFRFNFLQHNFVIMYNIIIKEFFTSNEIYDKNSRIITL